MTEPAPTPMPMCPMAQTCKRMMKSRFSGFGLMVPGFVFVALGILIVVEPRILAWVIAMAFILFGAVMLMIASFVRRVGGRS